MAKVTITGDVFVITSEYTLSQIKDIEKYKPGALKITEDVNGVKSDVFVVKTGDIGGLSKFGAVFSGTDRAGTGKATLTVGIPTDVEDAVQFVSDKYGAALLNLNQIEESLVEVIANLDADKAKVLNLITIA